MIGGFLYGSIWFPFGAASHDICARSGIDVAKEFSFAVVAIMAHGYAVAMCPTLSIWIEASNPCRLVKWLSSRCCVRRRHNGRTVCSVDSWCSDEFCYQC